jgi:hypothetical protein
MAHFYDPPELIERCMGDLARLRRVLAEFQDLNEKSRAFLANAHKVDDPRQYCQVFEPLEWKNSREEWRLRAEVTRSLAGRAPDGRVKATLMMIADTYDSFAKD